MKAIKPFFITLAIILAIGAIFLFVQKENKNDDNSEVTNQVTTEDAAEKNSKARTKANPVTKAIVSKTIDTIVEKEGGKVQEAFDSMSEEDKDTVEEIIASNVSLDAISELSTAAAENDSDAVMKYAQENFSEEDIEDLQAILEKYNVTP